MTQIKDSYVLLTGGSRGLGAVIAQALAQRGAHLALAARSQADLAQVAADLSPFGGRILSLPVDLSREENWQLLVSQVLEAFGRVDILINNAGLESEGAFCNLDLEVIRRTLEVNLAAPLVLTRLLLPHMLARGSGHIVQLSSIAARSGAPYDAVYGATKAGLAELNHALRLELAGSGVGFSTILPGYVTETGMFARFGVRAPSMIGSCNPRQVADAVVRAIQRNKTEVVVNSSPAAVLFAINAGFPALGDWISRRLGVADFQRRKIHGG